jgi:hypothetical protein
MDYIWHKHNLSMAEFKVPHTAALWHALAKQTVFKWSATIKLIHGWNPTYAALCRKGWEYTSICPQYKKIVETTDHVYKCLDTKVMDFI